MRYDVELDVYFNVEMEITEGSNLSRSDAFVLFTEDVHFIITDSNGKEYSHDIIDEYTTIEDTDLDRYDSDADYLFKVKVKVIYPVEADTDKEAIDKAYEIFYDSNIEVKVPEDVNNVTMCAKDIGYGDVWFSGLPY